MKKIKQGRLFLIVAKLLKFYRKDKGTGNVGEGNWMGRERGRDDGGRGNSRVEERKEEEMMEGKERVGWRRGKGKR